VSAVDTLTSAILAEAGAPPCPVPADGSSGLSNYEFMNGFCRPARARNPAGHVPPRQRSDGHIPSTPPPRRAGRGRSMAGERVSMMRGQSLRLSSRGSAKVDVHIFQGHIDHVRRFLGQSGVRSRDLDDLLLGWFGNVNLGLGGRMVNDLFGFRVHSHFFLRRGGDFLLRDLLLV
jgi:hypothetical protein